MDAGSVRAGGLRAAFCDDQSFRRLDYLHRTVADAGVSDDSADRNFNIESGQVRFGDDYHHGAGRADQRQHLAANAGAERRSSTEIHRYGPERRAE